MLNLQELHITINNTVVCRKLNASINPGEIWTIIGRNGSGKTTLLHTLANIIKPTSGTISYNGTLLNNICSRKLATHIGLLLQENHCHFPIRVCDMILSARFPYKKVTRTNDLAILDKVLTITELTALKHRFVNNLSGGEKRRCALATVFAQTPDIYLLDEPLNHLDLTHQRHIVNYVKIMAKEQHAGIVMSIHDLNLASNISDYTIALLGNGRYVSGKTSEVLNKPSVIAALALMT